MRFLVSKTPDNFIRTVNDEISSLLNRHFDSYFPQAGYWEGSQKLSMPIEVQDNGNDYVIRAELPGIKKEDLDISIEQNYLTLNAKKIKETNNKDENDNCLYGEFSYGEFSRTIQLPQEIDTDKADAKLEEGILQIVVPKLKKEKEHTKKLLVK